MKILIVEDTAMEMEKARVAAEALGLETVCYDPSFNKATNFGWHHDWDQLMEGVDGVCTDLYWGHPRSTGMYSVECDSKPCGLLVVINAISKGIPVVICSDVKNHHGPEAGFVYADYGKTRLMPGGNTGFKNDPTCINDDPACEKEGQIIDGTFGWEETKNWEWALKCLSRTITAKQS